MKVYPYMRQATCSLTIQLASKSRTNKELLNYLEQNILIQIIMANIFSDLHSFQSNAQFTQFYFVRFHIHFVNNYTNNLFFYLYLHPHKNHLLFFYIFTNHQTMPIRKERIPVQGVSNRSQKLLFGNLSDSLSTNVQLLKPSQSLGNFNQFTKTNQKQMNSYTSQNCKSQFSLSRKNQSGLINFTRFQQKQVSQHQQIPGKSAKHIQKLNSSSLFQHTISSSNLSSNAQKAVSKLRGIYKYKTNIKKIVKAWGFQNNAFIDEEQFRNIMSKHFQTQLTSSQAIELIKKVSNKSNNQNSERKLDMPSFIGLIYNSVPFPNPMIDINEKVDVSNQQAPLIKKIRNLNQINLYNQDSEDLKKIKRLPTLFKPTQKQSSKSFVFDQTLNKSIMSSLGEPSLHQTMYNSSHPKFEFSSKKSHAKIFSPVQYQSINQQKTRFNATPLLQLNDQSLPENKIERIFDQKLKIVSQLKEDKHFLKQRYENKLSKIRQNKENQNMMIQQIDKKNQMILKANMKKTWEENMAYQYVNFVKNDWK